MQLTQLIETPMIETSLIEIPTIWAASITNQPTIAQN